MKGSSLRIVALIAFAATLFAHGQVDVHGQVGASGQTGAAPQTRPVGTVAIIDAVAAPEANVAGSLALIDAAGTASYASDAWGQAANAVDTGADALGKLADVLKGILTDRKNAGTLVDRVSEALAKIPGMPSGRILQAKIMKGLGKAAGIIDGVVTSVTSVFKAVSAANAGDRETYKKEVADYIITMTGKIVGVAVGDAVFAGLTAATVGVGALPATGAGILAGSFADSGTKLLLKVFAKNAIENLVGRYYDWMTGEGTEGKGKGNPGGFDSDDPFDSEPENDGSGNMCPAQGGGSSGGEVSGGSRTTHPTTRRRGGSGGGDTRAKIW